MRLPARNSARVLSTPIGRVDRGQAAEGSNNWVIAPSRTQTGRPILRTIRTGNSGVPSLRRGPERAGPRHHRAGEPALPGIAIGHNDDIAFGITIFAIDQEDLYV